MTHIVTLLLSQFKNIFSITSIFENDSGYGYYTSCFSLLFYLMNTHNQPTLYFTKLIKCSTIKSQMFTHLIICHAREKKARRR